MSAAAPKELNTYRKYWASRFGTAPFLPMSRAEMDAARLGFLRRHHRHRRCLRRSPQLRHGHHGAVVRGAGISRRHHRAAGLAERRAVQAVRQAQPVLRHHRRQHGFDGEPLHLGQAHPQRRRVHARRQGRQAARIAASSSTRSARAKRSRMCPSSSAASRRRCAASRTSTTGARRFAAACLLDAKADLLVFGNAERQICEIAHRLAAGDDHHRDQRPARHRVRAQVA